MSLCAVIFSAASILNILGVVLNVVIWLTLLVLDLVLYLCGPFLSIMLSISAVFPLSGSHGVALLVNPPFSSILILGKFSFYGVTIKFLLLIGI